MCNCCISPSPHLDGLLLMIIFGVTSEPIIHHPAGGSECFAGSVLGALNMIVNDTPIGQHLVHAPIDAHGEVKAVDL
jgi:hypothetical protein